VLSEDLLNELRTVAYCKEAKPANRVAACNSLFRQRTDTERVADTLEEMALLDETPDKYRIAAIDLLARIRVDIGVKETQKAIDVQNIKDQLMVQFTNGSID